MNTRRAQRATQGAVRMHPLGVLALSYLAGAIPVSNVAAVATTGRDLREVGTGTVSGSGLYSVAGVRTLIAAGATEVALGFIGPTLAGSDRPTLAAIAGAASVCGHNWSLFLRGAGGRGIAPALGALLVKDQIAALTLVGGLAAGRMLHQSGLGTFVGALLAVPVAAARRGKPGALMGTAVVAPMLLKRLVGNHPPTRRSWATYGTRLVFDHDPLEQEIS